MSRLKLFTVVVALNVYAYDSEDAKKAVRYTYLNPHLPHKILQVEEVGLWESLVRQFKEDMLSVLTP